VDNGEKKTLVTTAGKEEGGGGTYFLEGTREKVTGEPKDFQRIETIKY